MPGSTPHETAIAPKSLREASSGFPELHYVGIRLSSRARGLELDLNLNPDKACNFDCVYCRVDRRIPGGSSEIDLEQFAAEFRSALRWVFSGELRQFGRFKHLPFDLHLAHAAFSGEGEPTLCPQFEEAVQTVVHCRALAGVRFKMVLMTNASGLDLPNVQAGLRLFTLTDEIWAKLETGSQAHMDQVHRAQAPIEKILQNILSLARNRPVVIQSLFPRIAGQPPPEREIDLYLDRLKQLKTEGAKIASVQIFSANRSRSGMPADHLPLTALSQIARKVREQTGLRAEVF